MSKTKLKFDDSSSPKHSRMLAMTVLWHEAQERNCNPAHFPVLVTLLYKRLESLGYHFEPERDEVKDFLTQTSGEKHPSYQIIQTMLGKDLKPVEETCQEVVSEPALITISDQHKD